MKWYIIWARSVSLVIEANQEKRVYGAWALDRKNEEKQSRFMSKVNLVFPSSSLFLSPRQQSTQIFLGGRGERTRHFLNVIDYGHLRCFRSDHRWTRCQTWLRVPDDDIGTADRNNSMARKDPTFSGENIYRTQIQPCPRNAARQKRNFPPG